MGLSAFQNGQKAPAQLPGWVIGMLQSQKGRNRHSGEFFCLLDINSRSGLTAGKHAECFWVRSALSDRNKSLWVHKADSLGCALAALGPHFLRKCPQSSASGRRVAARFPGQGGVGETEGRG